MAGPAPEALPAPGNPPPVSPQDTLFFASTPSGWIALGCLSAEGIASATGDCDVPDSTSTPLEIGQPSGETVQLEPAQTVICDPTGETTQGHLPIPSGAKDPLGWYPASGPNHWLPASRSPLRSDLLPMASAAAEKGLHERGYRHLNANRLNFHQVYRGDLEHNGREDLLVEAQGPPNDEDPPPSVLVHITDSAALLAPKGLDHNGAIELVGSWDTGSGSAVVLLQTFWAGGSGTHLVGFNAGQPTLLGQWVCGT